MDEDIYGADLYGGGSLGFDADPYPDTDFPSSNTRTANAGASAQLHASTSGQDHRAREMDDKVKELQGKLKDATANTDKWRQAFRDVASICGLAPAGGLRDPDVPSVLEAVQRIKNSEQRLQEEARQLRQREASLQVQLAERSLEGVEMRRELAVAQQAADPSVLQLKHLLLDTAVNREFQRLRGELEETQQELKVAQEELTAVNFTQESKIGRQLMSKCRALQEENEEMGRELAEGKLSQLDSQLAMAKEFAEEMRRNYLELEDHCTVLDEEAEEMQREIFALRRQVRDLEMGGGGGAPVAMGGGPGGDFGMRRGGPPSDMFGSGGGRGGGPFRGGGRGGGRGAMMMPDMDARKRMMSDWDGPPGPGRGFMPNKRMMR